MPQNRLNRLQALHITINIEKYLETGANFKDNMHREKQKNTADTYVLKPLRMS